MGITYSYTVAAVDPAARCMEIVYESEGRQTMRIGARLPFVGEILEDVVRAYAPIRFWEEQELSVVVPQVGATGVIVPPPAPVPLPQPEVSGAQVL